MGEIAKREIIDAEIVSIDDSARAHNINARVFRQFVMDGDLSKIEKSDRPALVMALCNHIGIDPIERPFMVLKDGKREVLYATRSCTSALCRERKIDRKIISVEERSIAGQTLVVAHARATMVSTGRSDESTGAVPVMQAEFGPWKTNSKGKSYRETVGWRMPDPNEAANLVMKAETKAKRRAVLDLVGLGITDESEIEGIKGARVAQLDMHTGELLDVGQPLAIAEGKPEPRVDIGPRCSGKSAGIGKAIDERLAELAELRDLDKGKLWRAAIKHAGVDVERYQGTLAGPDSLTVDDGLAVKSVIDAKLEEYRPSQQSEDDRHNPEDGGPDQETASLRRWVTKQWEQLAAGDYVEPSNWKAQWAKWAGLQSWPDRPSHDDWANCAEGMRGFIAGIEADQ